MKNKISSEYVPRNKVLTFADFMHYRIVIVENTQSQYFDNLLCASVLKNDSTVKHQVSQYNALFLPTLSEPILVFVRKAKWKSTANFPI